MEIRTTVKPIQFSDSSGCAMRLPTGTRQEQQRRHDTHVGDDQLAGLARVEHGRIGVAPDARPPARRAELSRPLDFNHAIGRFPSGGHSEPAPRAHRARNGLTGSLHQPVLRTASALARRPSRAQYIRRLAVHAIRWIHHAARRRPAHRRRRDRGGSRSRRPRREMSLPTIRWDGMVSRVAFPDLKTASTLLKVRVLSGTNGVARHASRGASASCGIAIRPPGKRAAASPSSSPP